MRSARPLRPAALRPLAITALALALGGCNMLSRLSEVGDAPVMSSVGNPAPIAGEQPIEVPMPTPMIAAHQPNSLWRPGSRAFLKDQRASEVGDLVTVEIQIDASAQLDNSTNRSRDAQEGAALDSFLGYEDLLDELVPGDVNNVDLVDLNSVSNSDGSGSINRAESINLRVAAMVTQVLPNGNLVVAGRQEVRVNYEMRELQVAGIIRPEDIASTNTIAFDQIAEARIAYGGRGALSDLQQPRYGQQIFDILWPF